MQIIGRGSVRARGPGRWQSSALLLFGACRGLIADRGERDDRDGPGGLLLVGVEGRIAAGLLGLRLVAFVPGQFGGVHVEDVAADLDRRVGMDEQVVVPVMMRMLNRLRRACLRAPNISR